MRDGASSYRDNGAEPADTLHLRARGDPMTTNILRNQFDERLHAGISERLHYLGTSEELVLAHYVLEARRKGWTWDLIADALHKSPSVAKRLFRMSADFQSGKSSQEG